MRRSPRPAPRQRLSWLDGQAQPKRRATGQRAPGGLRDWSTRSGGGLAGRALRRPRAGRRGCDHRGLGARRAARGIPYESGIKPAGPLPKRLSVEFYQVALFFVIFDLEAVFIFAWAVNARRLGWTGYLEIVVFVALLFAGLVYLWKVGGLDWGAAGRRRRLRRGRPR